MTDPTPTERLIEAWIAWDATPGDQLTTRRRLAAITAAGLPSIRTHQVIAAARHAGQSVPSAVQTAINELSEIRRAS